MEYYKIEINSYQAQIQHLNNEWITQYRLNNPHDNVTQRYVDEWVWIGFGYIVKDTVTEQYITNFVELVEELPTRWHEEKNYQIIQKKSGLIWGVMNEPEIISGLSIYRKENDISVYEEDSGDFYFYVDFILPEHQLIFDTYPLLEITVNQN